MAYVKLSEEEYDNIDWLPDLYKFSTEKKLLTWRCGTWKTYYYSETGQVFNKDGNLAKLKVIKKLIKPTKKTTALEQVIIYANDEWLNTYNKRSYRPYDTIPLCNAHQWSLLHNDLKKWPSVWKDWDDMVHRNRICNESQSWMAHFLIGSLKENNFFTEEKEPEIKPTVNIQEEKASIIAKYKVKFEEEEKEYELIMSEDDILNNLKHNDDDVSNFVPIKLIGRTTVWYVEEQIFIYDEICREKTNEILKVNLNLSTLQFEELEILKQQMQAVLSLIHVIVFGTDDIPDTLEIGLDGEIVFGNSTCSGQIEDKLQFAWYDIMEYGTYNSDGENIKPPMTTQQRFTVIESVEKTIQEDPEMMKEFSSIIFLPRRKLLNVDQIYEFKNYATRCGYESIILKRANLVYTKNYDDQNDNIVKFTNIWEEEYPIVGFELQSTTLVWKLQDPIYTTIFLCPQIGSVDIKMKYMENTEQYIGKCLRISYFEKNEQYIPIEPRGLYVDEN